MSKAVAHIAGFTDYCIKCGLFIITDCEVIHECPTGAQVVKSDNIDVSVGNALFGNAGKGI